MQTLSNNNIQTMTSDNVKIISASIALACVRWNKDIDKFPLQQFCKDLNSTFPNLDIEDIVKAIKNGGLGVYGNVYDLSIGQIMVWIRKYIQDNPPKTVRNPYLDLMKKK